MKMNRVQFQPGLSVPEFFESYGTEVKCQAALQAARWPKGFVCPSCARRAPASFAAACPTGSAAPALTSAA